MLFLCRIVFACCRLTSDSADAQESLSAELENLFLLCAFCLHCCRLTSDSADALESLSAELERSKASVARLLKES
jgi:hypothetical protein